MNQSGDKRNFTENVLYWSGHDSCRHGATRSYTKTLYNWDKLIQTVANSAHFNNSMAWHWRSLFANRFIRQKKIEWPKEKERIGLTPKWRLCVDTTTHWQPAYLSTCLVFVAGPQKERTTSTDRRIKRLRWAPDLRPVGPSPYKF